MNSIQEYSKTDAALAELKGRYAGVVYDVATKDGYETARKARAELKGYRVDLEKVRKEIKAPALERCRLIDEEAKRITAALAALEDPIDAQLKAEDARLEEVRTRFAREEAARVAEAERLAKEAEEKKLAEARAEIEREKAALQRQREEQERLERERRAAIEEAEARARRAIEEEERKARMAREEADRAARVAREAEEAKLKAERDRVEAEKRAVEAAQRRAREEQEEKERVERARVEAEERRVREEQEAVERAARDREASVERERLRAQMDLGDARTMLATFRKRFGHIGEFEPVIDAINLVLDDQPF